MNLLRNTGRKAKVVSLSDEFDVPDQENEKNELVSEEALKESLSLLAKEKPLFYDVLHLHIFGKMTFKEIGKINEKSKDTISSRYRYAIHYLRKFIQYEQPQSKEVSL